MIQEQEFSRISIRFLSGPWPVYWHCSVHDGRSIQAPRGGTHATTVNTESS